VDKIEEGRISVKLNDGTTHWVDKVTWEKVKYSYNKTTKETEKKIVGTFTNGRRGYHMTGKTNAISF
jgi:hypothetical protein